MRAVILAAGRGTRIAAVHAAPKCLLGFGGDTILDYQIHALAGAGIREIGLVVGYERERIVDHIAHRYLDSGLSIDFITNPRFAVTNNIYSLGLARSWVGFHRLVVLNADVLFHPQIFSQARRPEGDISLVVDPAYREETAKVIIRNGRVVTLSKGIPRGEASGTFVNIATFSRRGAQMLFDTIDAMIAQGRVDVFFNQAIMRLGGNGVPIGFTEVRGLPWVEIDDPGDLDYARREIYPALPPLAVPGEEARGGNERWATSAGMDSAA